MQRIENTIAALVLPRLLELASDYLVAFCSRIPSALQACDPSALLKTSFCSSARTPTRLRRAYSVVGPRNFEISLDEYPFGISLWSVPLTINSPPRTATVTFRSDNKMGFLSLWRLYTLHVIQNGRTRHIAEEWNLWFIGSTCYMWIAAEEVILRQHEWTCIILGYMYMYFKKINLNAKVKGVGTYIEDIYNGLDKCNNYKSFTTCRSSLMWSSVTYYNSMHSMTWKKSANQSNIWHLSIQTHILKIEWIQKNSVHSWKYVNTVQFLSMT